jgi:hypothetical protein
MTVAAKSPTISYQEDGSTLAFPVPWYFLSPGDLVVKRTTAAGTVTTLVLFTDYNVSGGTAAAGDNGGTVTLVATVAGSTLAISRNTARVQPIHYATNDSFPSATAEVGLDRDMLIEQEQDNAIANINNIGVGHADTADYATNSGHATNADQATNATNAGTAGSAGKWTTPRNLSFTGDVAGTLGGLDGSADASAALTLTVDRVRISDTYTIATPAGVNKWPRLNGAGVLDSSLISMPSALHYKGTIDPTQPPPANPQLGDLWICANAGTVNAGYGPPAGGQAAKAGDWLAYNAYGQWQFIPPGAVQEAPEDGHFYGRVNGFWQSGGSMAGALAINMAVQPATCLLQVNGNASLMSPTPNLGFNGYINQAGNGWIAPNAGSSGVISFNATDGQLKFWTTPIPTTANYQPITPIFAGCFGPDGGFNVGTQGGDYTTNWAGVFRRNQDASTQLGLINGNATANASAQIRMITGTANSYWNLLLADNAGAPYAVDNLGPVVQYRAWDMGGAERMRLTAGGALGVGFVPFNASSSFLQTAGDITIAGTGANPQCTLMFNVVYASGWVATHAGACGAIKMDGSGGALSFQLSSANVAAGAASAVREVAHILQNGDFYALFNLNVANYIYASKVHAIAAVDGASFDARDQAGNPKNSLLRFTNNDGSAVYGTLGYAGGGNLTLTNSVGPVVLSASTSIVTTSNVTNQADIFQPNIPASAASANLVAASGNNWQRLHSTSSRRYKTNIVDLPGTIADNLLKLRPVAFTSLCEADDPEVLHYGFVAEEIAEIDPRLVQFGYDGPARKDELMVPTGLEYNELIALLTATAQRQAQEIQSLRGRLTKLEQRKSDRKAK